MASPQQPAESPNIKLMQLITGHWVSAAIHATARLGLADQLRDAPRSSDEVAKSVGAHGPSVYRLLRALSNLGVVEERPGKTFVLTKVGELLRADHPQSVRAMALFQGAAPHWRGWGNFLHSVRTGESSFEHVHGQGFFDYCQTDPEFSENFNAAMTGMSAGMVDAVIEAYDFSGIRRLIDVGGGHGHLLCGVLRRYPSLQGAIVDLPHVVAGAKPALEAAGLAPRCELVDGSFFEALPPADAYIAKHIIHDWDDEHSRTILQNMRSAMQGQGKVLLVECVIRLGEHSFAPLLDLEMLNSTHGGKERTEEEFRELFASAGLRLNRIVETKGVLSVLEALPIK